jgi:hypothetical protein
MNKMGNIQHPTTNIEQPMNSRAPAHWMLGVGCWVLDVSHFKTKGLP